MNEVQKVVYQLLHQFLSVCKELNLNYYFVNGSALGAVKYSGFIEWDDDIDVAMPRKDYEIFCSKAQEILPDNVFLQNYRTDPKFPQIYSKLRNSDTTFIESGSERLSINHGCYLDIFPLDDYSIEGRSRFESFRLKLLNTFRVCSLNDTRTKKIIIRNKILRFFGFHRRTSAIIKKIESIITGPKDQCEYWCNYGDRQYFCNPIHKSVFGNGFLVLFEDTEICVPEKYDDYLSVKYGDWRKDPPKEDRVSHHTTAVIDVHKPYTEYINY